MAGRELIYFLLGVQLTPPPFFPVPTPPEPAYESPPTYGAGALSRTCSATICPNKLLPPFGPFRRTSVQL